MFRLFASRTMVRRPATARGEDGVGVARAVSGLVEIVGAFHDQRGVVLSARRERHEPAERSRIGDRFARQSLIGDDRRLRRVSTRPGSASARPDRSARPAESRVDRTVDAGAVSALLPSSPLVMLSPKAKNRVTASFGGGGTARTVIANEQTSARCSASVAVHDTVVVPTLNVDPDTRCAAGRHRRLAVDEGRAGEGDRDGVAARELNRLRRRTGDLRRIFSWRRRRRGTAAAGAGEQCAAEGEGESLHRVPVSLVGTVSLDGAVSVCSTAFIAAIALAASSNAQSSCRRWSAVGSPE